MKKITIIAFLLLIITINLIGQDNKFSVGLIGSLGTNKFYFEETGFNYDYISKLDFSYGIGFQYYFLEKVFISSGIKCLTIGYKVKYNYILRDPGDPAFPRQSELNVSYLKVPIMIGYKVFQTKKFSFNPSLGISICFETNRTGTTIYEDNSERESELLDEDINTTIVLCNLDFGVEYHLKDKFKIGLEPYIGKGLNKLNDDTMSSGQLSYGGIPGLFYIF